MNKIKYLLFDMDGVLVDSMQCHVQSWQKALLDFGLEVKTDDLFHLGGVSFVDTIKILSNKYNKNFSDDDLHNIHKLKLKYFDENYHITVFDGIIDYLNLLKEKGFRICIVSGAIRDVVDRVVSENFKGMFEFTISEDDVENGKPNPEPYLMARDKFGVSSDECLVVEDSPSGILSAKAGGIKVFGITTTLKAEELYEANKIFESHKELFDYILKNS